MRPTVFRGPKISEHPHHLYFVFGYLIGDVAHAGGFNGERGEVGDILVVVDLPSHGEDEVVDLLLGVVRHLGLRAPGALEGSPRRGRPPGPR